MTKFAKNLPPPSPLTDDQYAAVREEVRATQKSMREACIQMESLTAADLRCRVI